MPLLSQRLYGETPSMNQPIAITHGFTLGYSPLYRSTSGMSSPLVHFLLVTFFPTEKRLELRHGLLTRTAINDFTCRKARGACPQPQFCHSLFPDESVLESICYSVFFLHRNKDLWGEDGTPLTPAK